MACIFVSFILGLADCITRLSVALSTLRQYFIHGTEKASPLQAVPHCKCVHENSFCCIISAESMSDIRQICCLLNDQFPSLLDWFGFNCLATLSAVRLRASSQRRRHHSLPMIYACHRTHWWLSKKKRFAITLLSKYLHINLIYILVKLQQL